LIRIDLDVPAGVSAATCWIAFASRWPSAFWDLPFGSVIIYLRMRIVVVVGGEDTVEEQSCDQACNAGAQRGDTKR
jgi:hypothetical protein